MRKNKLLLLLALLLTAVTGARADWTGGTYTATANENLGAITVNGDATLTINSDVTVTITGGINVASGTLTVTGPGTLVVNGAKGNNGASGWKGNNGGNGGVAISGNIIVQGGATVTATGGTGGNGGSGELEAGSGGNGGVAFAGTLTYKSGTVTANGGSAGSGGYIEDEEEYASSGSAGKAFANDVDFTQTTGYSVTNGTSTIGSVLNQTKVVISGGTEPAAAAGYTVSLKDGVKDADKWTVKVGEGQAQALPIGGLKGDGSETVTLQYTGRLKVKGVKATSDAAPAAVPVTAITLNKTETSIKVGSTETLSVTAVAPDNATDKTYTWKTSDASKATVDQDGKVTAVAEGTVTIYAEANDGSGVKGNCTVTVTPATITVTINQSDWGGWSNSFTKDGVTVSAGAIDPDDGNLMNGGTFSTTLGNFTKIVVTTAFCNASGTGWSGGDSSKTWAGTPASTVSFSGDFMGMGMTQTTIVCTIVPKN